MDFGPDRADLTRRAKKGDPTAGLGPPPTPGHGRGRRPPRALSVDARADFIPQNRSKKCGIYYLVDYVEEGEVGKKELNVVVLYIGATKNIEKRIARHVRDQQIGFCDVYFDPCEESELEEREARAIAEFRPVLLGKNMPR